MDALSEEEARQLVDDYIQLLKLARREIVRPPGKAEVARSRRLIRHEVDVPVLLSAMRSRPDWLPTHNREHFIDAVARRTGLRIATPAEFFRNLAAI